MSEIVGACLSQFHDDENRFELLLAYSDGREVGFSVSRQVAQKMASEFANALIEREAQPVKVPVELMERIWANLFYDEEDAGNTFQKTLNEVVDLLAKHNALPAVAATEEA